MNNTLSNRNKFLRIQKIIIGIVLLGLIGCIALLFEPVQIFIISMVEKIVKHRKLNYPLRAQQRLEFYSFIGIVSCIITGTIVLVVTKMAKFKEFLSGLAHKKCWGIPVKNIITELPFVIISIEPVPKHLKG